VKNFHFKDFLGISLGSDLVNFLRCDVAGILLSPERGTTVWSSRTCYITLVPSYAEMVSAWQDSFEMIQVLAALE